MTNYLKMWELHCWFLVLLRRTCFAVRDRVRDPVRDQETILEQISNIVAVLNDYNICHEWFECLIDLFNSIDLILSCNSITLCLLWFRMLGQYFTYCVT